MAPPNLWTAGDAPGPRFGHAESPRAPALPGEGAGEQIEQARDQSGMAGCEEADPAREGEHPLPDGNGGEDVLDEVLGGVLHSTGVAGRADVGLAGEGHQPLETAVGAADSPKAPGEDAAVEIRAQLALDVGGEAPAMGAPLACGGEEWLEPFANQLVQERLLGLAPPVPADRRGGGAGVTLPGLGVFGRSELGPRPTLLATLVASAAAPAFRGLRLVASLEHVDSPSRNLAEIHRVLVLGGGVAEGGPGADVSAGDRAVRVMIAQSVSLQTRTSGSVHATAGLSVSRSIRWFMERTVEARAEAGARSFHRD